jgi:AI-2 transport protein TqsA
MMTPLQGTAERSIGQLPRPVMILLTLAAAVGVIAGMRAIAGTLGPAFLALLLVVSLHPVQAALQRRGLPAWVGVLALLLTVYAVLLGLAAALVLSTAQLAVLLPTYEPQFRDLIDQLTSLLAALGIGRDEIRSAQGQLDLSNLVGVLRGVLGGVRTVLSDLSFIVVLIFFLGVDAAHFSDRVDAAAQAHPQVVAGLHTFVRGTRRYVLVSTVFGLVVALVDIGALYWLAIPLPLLWGLLSFITNYIPNVGFVLGLFPPALLGLLEGGVGRMVGVVVAYSVINVVIQSLLQPKFVGDAVGMSATLTFLSLVFWAFVIGPLGALLAVPLSLLVKALLIDTDPANQWLRPLLGDRAEAGSAAGKSRTRASRAEAASTEDKRPD